MKTSSIFGKKIKISTFNLYNYMGAKLNVYVSSWKVALMMDR